MKTWEVRYGRTTNILGKVLEGWFVLEDGRPGYPYESKEKAEAAMEALKQIRHVTRPVMSDWRKP